jgi:hypothetical protein
MNCKIAQAKIFVRQPRLVSDGTSRYRRNNWPPRRSEAKADQSSVLVCCRQRVPSIPSALYGAVLLMAALAYYLLQTLIIAVHGRHSKLTKAIG